MISSARFSGSLVGLFLVVGIADGCSGEGTIGAGSHSSSTGGATGSAATAAATGAGGSADATGSGGSATTGGSGGTGGSVSGGGSAGTPGGPDADIDAPPGVQDASDGAPDTGTAPEAGPVGDPCGTPMGTDGGPKPSYEGEIPIYCGPPVGPIVEMQCPGDPTEGWTEYRDSFNVQRPYTVPINTRFSIIGGVYNFWVFPNDTPHSPTAHGKNPRTEAKYGGTYDRATGGNFKTGMRLYSADMLIEKNAIDSAIMQIHTTADGGGPIGVRIEANGDMVNNGSLTVVHGNNVPGGLIDKWFNYKASLDTATLEVKIYINNCLQSTYKGDPGDRNFYFKNGVYFCSAQNGCFTHYKNIHLYKK